MLLIRIRKASGLNFGVDDIFCHISLFFFPNGTVKEVTALCLRDSPIIGTLRTHLSSSHNKCVGREDTRLKYPHSYNYEHIGRNVVSGVICPVQ